MRGSRAIPVGNRVEISIFALNTGVFREKLDPAIYDPMVRDLTSGVVYAQTWHYAADGADVTKLPLEVRRDLRVAEQVVGQVRFVRIVTGLCPDDSGRHGYVTSMVVLVD